MLEHIEKIKQDFTDKYVVVDDSIAELSRFVGAVGQVKTVNMTGRALVQFDAWNNIGWYDIEVEYLRVVPKPEAGASTEKHETKKALAKPAAATTSASPGEKKLSPLEMARMQGAAGSGAAAKSPAPAAGVKKSTADILAAARAAKASVGDTAPAKPVATKQPAAQEESASARGTVATAAPSAKPAVSKLAVTPGQRPSVNEILAWCRQHDRK